MVILLGLLLAVSPLNSGSIQGASWASALAAAAPSSPTPSLSLGFGPSSMSPVADGTPVYTVGDTLWAESDYNSSVPLSVTSAAAGSSPAAVVLVTLILSHSVVPLYTFTSKDVDGVWSVKVGDPQGTIVIPVHFVNPASHPVSLSSVSYALAGGNMSISATASLGDSYDQEVCAAGNATSEGLTLALPRDMREKGNITLLPGDPFKTDTAGNVTEPFSFWFELYYPYALDVTSANNLVVNDLMAAASQPVTFTSAAMANITMGWSLPPREGRYELRAFFQNSTSLDTFESRVLLMNDTSWVPLTDVCQTQSVQSPTLDYSASLTKGQDNWPRNIYVMYRTFGVEGVYSLPVSANLSSIAFLATPWNEPIPDIKVDLSPNPDIISSSQAGSSLFLLAHRYPVSVDYSLDVAGGHDLEQGSVTIRGSFSTQTSTFDLAKLTVDILSDQNSPRTLQVTGPQGLNLTRNVLGNNRSATFLLPAGSYSVTLSQGGSSQSAQVVLTDGHATAVTLNFSTFLTFETILIVTAIVAAIGNVLIWVLRTRSLGSRMAPRKDA
ncbi:MAG: hypothetical protein OK455_05710 [Thaumarchaeota archaeon]|nr:hypothetical protein [Nitrososphaerota archaeon]